ncbi:MAG: hypothetical protein HY719_09755 [Planctomycetes bacterium]|nr:hypothetical protein [Planctomycetota bacterium]
MRSSRSLFRLAAVVLLFFAPAAGIWAGESLGKGYKERIANLDKTWGTRTYDFCDNDGSKLGSLVATTTKRVRGGVEYYGFLDKVTDGGGGAATFFSAHLADERLTLIGFDLQRDMHDTGKAEMRGRNKNGVLTRLEGERKTEFPCPEGTVTGMALHRMVTAFPAEKGWTFAFPLILEEHAHSEAQTVTITCEGTEALSWGGKSVRCAVYVLRGAVKEIGRYDVTAGTRDMLRFDRGGRYIELRHDGDAAEHTTGEPPADADDNPQAAVDDIFKALEAKDYARLWAERAHSDLRLMAGTRENFAKVMGKNRRPAMDLLGRIRQDRVAARAPRVKSETPDGDKNTLALVYDTPREPGAAAGYNKVTLRLEEGRWRLVRFE